jgi:hypothetical protein
MIDRYYTLYVTDYGTAKAQFKDYHTFDDAVKIGSTYCQEEGFEYKGTYNENEINEAEQELRLELYGSNN